MANKRIDMLEIKQLIQLKEKGISNREISRRLFINRKTVDQYIKSFKKLGLSFKELSCYTEADLQELFTKPVAKLDERTYQRLHELLPLLVKESKAIGATILELWRYYKQLEPDGYGYTQFKKYLNDYQDKPELSMHVEHKMGDKLFVDYAGKRLEIIDRHTGEVKPVEVFVGILGGSQYMYVEATETQQQDDLISSLCNSLECFEGVPQAIVPDNMKQAVVKSNKYEPNINKQLRAFACHYKTSILPTRSYKPKDKALVEGAVKLVYQRIYFHLRGQLFFSLQELNAAIKKLLHEKINSALFQSRDYSRLMLFEQEQPLLQPLPESRYQIRYFHKATVQKSYHIYFSKDKHYYSVPHAYIGKEVAIQYNRNLIEVYYDHQRIAVHRRSGTIGGYTTVTEHMPERHQYVRGWSADYFLEWAGQQHERVHYFMEQLFKQATHPEQAYKSCMGIQSLKRQYGLTRLVNACKRAMEYDQYRYKVLENILRKGVDKQPELALDHQESTLPNHHNIRGKEYYQ